MFPATRTSGFGVRVAVAFAAAVIFPLPAVSGENAAPHADWCERLSPRLPGISTDACLAGGLKPTGARSLKNFPILARHFVAAPSAVVASTAAASTSAASHAAAKLPVRIMLLGGIHGDELTAAAIVFKWLRFMETPAARQFDWHVVPVVNPDGLLATKPMRVNANGVDLNRNFPTPGWAQEAPRYWANRTRSDPRRFPGHAPLSEPETLWLSQEMERYKPQVIISVHAPFGVLDFDGKVEPPRRFGRLLLSQVGVYPGSLGNYGGLHKNVPVITIELPNARAMPPDAEVRRIWQDMLKWIEKNVPAEVAPPPTPPSPVILSTKSPADSGGLWNDLGNWIRRKLD